MLNPVLQLALYGLAYIVLAWLTVRFVASASSAYRGRLARDIALAILAGALFAPSLIVLGGHDGAALFVGPAWFAAIQEATGVRPFGRGFWLTGIAPILFVAGLALMVLRARSR